MEEHLGFNVRSMGCQPFGEEGERVVETGRYDEWAGELGRVEEGSTDLIDGHVGSFGRRLSRDFGICDCAGVVRVQSLLVEKNSC